MQRNKYLRQLGFGIIAGLVALAVTFGFTIERAGASPGDVSLGAPRSPNVNVSPLVQQLNSTFVEVAKAVKPSIVRIEVTSTPKPVNLGPNDQGDNFFKFFFGPDWPFPDFKFNIPKIQPMPQVGLGSGVIISPEGYILTNNHVVAGAEKGRIEVTLTDKRQYQAKLVGRDPETDLAVLKIDGHDLPVAALGNSDSIQVGEWVLAIGNPLGLNFTVTAGIVSAVGRDIGIIRDKDNYAIENFIQTDAAINPGNSGGALVNLYGQVIGINTAIETNTGGYVGYGFAIPINLAKSVALQLIKHGKVTRAYIGVQIQAIDETMAKALGMKRPEGVLVQSIVKGSPAESAGLEQGDVILKADGKKISQPNELQILVANKQPGDEVTLTVLRNGKEFEKTITLQARSKESTLAENAETSSESSENAASATVESLGLTVENIDAKVKKEYDVNHGVLITDVQVMGPAYQRGLRQGYVILDVDRKPIKSVAEFERIVREHKPGDSLLLRVKDSKKNVSLVAVELQTPSS